MNALRTIGQVTAAWVVTTALGVPLILLMLCSFGRLREAIGRPGIRAWGKALLWVGGVKLVVEGAEHLDGRRPRIVTFNHISTLDSFIVNALLPDGGMPVAARSSLPIFGQILVLGPIIVLDKGGGPRSRAAMKKVEARIRDEALSLLIAPEGTRRGEDKPSRFKLGAFELARVTGAPIVPMVIMGAERLMPYGALTTKPGRLVIRILPPIPSDGFTTDNLRDQADALHERYRVELGLGEPTGR